MKRIIDLISLNVCDELEVKFINNDTIEALWADWVTLMKDEALKGFVLIHHIELEKVHRHFEKNKVDYLKEYPYAKNEDFLKWYFYGLGSLTSNYLHSQDSVLLHSTDNYKLFKHDLVIDDYYTGFSTDYDLTFMRQYLSAIDSFKSDIIHKDKHGGVKINEELRTKKSKLKWNKNKIDFIELAKSLIENKAFGDVTQKDILLELNQLFDVELSEDDIRSGKKITDLKKRNAGEEIKYLNVLHKNLEDWLKKET